MRRNLSTSCCSGPGGGAPRWRVPPEVSAAPVLKPAAVERRWRPMAISEAENPRQQ
jgi:hypothetical protein